MFNMGYGAPPVGDGSLVVFFLPLRIRLSTSRADLMNAARDERLGSRSLLFFSI